MTKHQDFYWLLKKTGKSTNRIKNKDWREQVEKYDKTAKWLVKYHAGVKKDGMMMLEAASWFIPVGWVAKLKYVKYAANLFKFKRGVVVTNTVNKATTTILGKKPAYLKVADEMGYNAFNISEKGLTASQIKAKNMEFLDEAIKNGHEFIFSHKVQAVANEVGGFRDELNYLISKGYHLASDGLSMIK